MKRIIIISMLLVGFVSSYSQTFLPPRSSPTTTVQDSRLRALLNFYYPHTHGLTLNNGLDTLGMVMYEDSSGHVWYRDTVLAGGHKWSMLLKVGDGVSGVSSFNTRTGAVTLSSGDVVTALGFAPINPNGTSFQYIAGDGSKVTFPTIPAQINITDAGLFQHSGTYPNYTFTGLTPTQQQVFTQGSTLTTNNFWVTGANVLGMTGTAAFGLPTGSTSQRPSSPGTGYFRYNTDSSATETYNGSQWVKTGTGTGVTGVTSFNTRTGAVTLTGSDVTTALTFTPYNATNPAAYISNITGLISSGANITITGSGTVGSPYVIVGTGSGSVFNQDSIKHRFVDTGSTARNLYTLAWDSVNKKWVLTAPGTGGGGTGTVTNFSFTNANGFTGTVTNSSTIPVLTVGTSITGLLFGNGTAISNATVSSPLTYSAGTLGIQVANTSQNGYLSSTDWNTFNGKINLSSLSATSPVLYNNGTGVISEQVANTSQNGYLSSTDWNTFNGKQSALSGTGYLNFTGTTPSYLTPTQVTANLNLFTTTLQGLVPAPSTVTGKVLSDNGTWVSAGGTGTVTSVAATVPGTLLTIGGSPITGAGTLAFGLATASANLAFGNFTGSTATPTFGKLPLAAMATGTDNTLIGYDGSGNPSGITVSTGLNLSAGVLTATGSSQTFQQTLTTGSLLTTNNTVNQANHNFIWSGGGVFGLDSVKFTTNTNVKTFLVPTTFYWGGNSYPACFTPATGTTCFVSRLATDWNVAVNNQSVSSTGMWTAISTFNSLVGPVNGFGAAFMTDLNDYRRGGINNEKTYNKVMGGYTSIFSNQFLKYYQVAGTGANVTRYIASGGNWIITYQGQLVGGKSINNGAYDNGTPNDSLVFVTPSPDSTVIIGLIGTDSSAGNRYSESIDLYVDNTLVRNFSENNRADGITDGSNDNTRSPFCIIIHNLNPATTHKVKLVNRTALAYPIVIDYFGGLIDVSLAPPLLLYHTAYLNAAGYAASPANASNAAILKGNNKMDSTIATFPASYPVFVVPTENYWDTLTCLASDNIHPNDVGYQKLEQAALSVLPNVKSGVQYASTAGTLQAARIRPLFYNTTGGHQVALIDDISQASGIGGSGTVNFIPKFTGSSILGNSALADSGSKIRSTENIIVGTTQAEIGSVQAFVASSGMGILATTHFPYYYAYNSFAPTNTKLFDQYVDDSGIWHWRYVNDANNAPVEFATFKRSTTTPTSVYFAGRILLGSTTDDAIERLQVTGTLKVTDTLKTPNIVRKLLDTTNFKPEVVDASGNHWKTDWATFGGSQTLTYAQNATNNTLSISGGNSQTFLTATQSLAGLLDTGRAKSIDSLRNGLKTFNLYFANGLTASTVIPDSAYWGGTLNQTTAVLQAGFGVTISGGQFTLGATGTRNWNPNNLLAGSIFSVNTSTLNDNVTAASGTILNIEATSVSAPILSATNSSVTYTNAYTMFINGPPTASTNVSITNGYGLGVGGSIYSSGYVVSTLSRDLTVSESSGASITMGLVNSNWIATGTTATYTLPALSTSLGIRFYVKNAGSGTLTVQRAGSDNLYDVASVTSVTLAPGTARVFVGGSTFWWVE